MAKNLLPKVFYFESSLTVFDGVTVGVNVDPLAKIYTAGALFDVGDDFFEITFNTDFRSDINFHLEQSQNQVKQLFRNL